MLLGNRLSQAMEAPRMPIGFGCIDTAEETF